VPYLSALEMSFAHIIKRYTNVLFTYFTYIYFIYKTLLLVSWECCAAESDLHACLDDVQWSVAEHGGGTCHDAEHTRDDLRTHLRTHP